MKTECSNRLFEILRTFVESDQRDRETDIQISIQNPEEEIRARIMQLIHYVEDLFISYAFDVIKRVLSDFES